MEFLIRMIYHAFFLIWGIYSIRNDTWLPLCLAYILSAWGTLFYSVLFGRILYNNLTVTSVEAVTMAYYENPAVHRKADHPVIKAFSVPKIKWMATKIPDFSTLSVLDVGGGSGYWSTYMVDYCPNVHVLDISKEQLKMNPLPWEQKHVGTAYELSKSKDLQGKEFDVVFGSNLLHHLDRPVEAVKEYVKVAKKYVVIMEPVTNNPIMWLACQYPPWEFGVKRFTKAYVQGLMEEAGLKVIHHTYMGGMLLANRTPEWMLPLTFYWSKSKYSYFQLYICEKKDQAQ